MFYGGKDTPTLRQGDLLLHARACSRGAPHDSCVGVEFNLGLGGLGQGYSSCNSSVRFSSRKLGLVEYLLDVSSERPSSVLVLSSVVRQRVCPVPLGLTPD